MLQEVNASACILCNKAHRKCDRQKPCCSSCTIRNIECKYESNGGSNNSGSTSPKRKKQKRELPYQAMVSNFNVKKSHASTTVYNSPLSQSYLLLDPDRVQAVSSGESKQEEDIACILALQCWSHIKTGNKSESQKYFQECLRVLSTKMDTIYTNTTISRILVLLCTTLVHENERLRIRFYLNIVIPYFEAFDYLRMSSPLERERHKFFHVEACMASFATKHNESPEDYLKTTVKSPIEISIFVKISLSLFITNERIKQFTNQNNGRCIPQELIEFSDKCRSDILYKTNSQIIDRKTLQWLSPLVRGVYLVNSEQLIHDNDHFIIMIIEGAKMQFLFFEDMLSSRDAQESAVFVSKSTVTDVFKFCAANVIHSVIFAAVVHTYLVKNATNIGDRKCALDWLKIDREALEHLIDKFDYAIPRCARMVKQIMNTIEMYNCNTNYLVDSVANKHFETNDVDFEAFFWDILNTDVGGDEFIVQ
ncbi:hypothetical protein AKO1_006035 [Acrasis kona]|uniref:Zn(2)-C6 fungal-type domain-containing protein n=1 Tax=Acrasis kona TaxID=1008807 RepID=A0AAW2YJA9_9EUKA